MYANLHIQVETANTHEFIQHINTGLNSSNLKLPKRTFHSIYRSYTPNNELQVYNMHNADNVLLILA